MPVSTGAKVDMIGGEEREIQISVDPVKLQGYGLSINQVQQVVAASNLDFPTGSVSTEITVPPFASESKFDRPAQELTYHITVCHTIF